MAIGDPTSVQAKTGIGLKFYVDKGGAARLRNVQEWTFVEGMRSGTLPSPDKPEIDVTTTTDIVKAFIPGMGSINDMALEFNFYPDNELHLWLVGEVLYEDTPRPWKLEGLGLCFTFMAYLKSANIAFGVDTACQMPLTFKVTTAPILTHTETGTKPDPDLPEPEGPGEDGGSGENGGTEGENPGDGDENETPESRAARLRAAAKHY